MIHRIWIFDGSEPIGFEFFTTREKAEDRIRSLARIGYAGEYMGSAKTPKTDLGLCLLLNGWLADACQC